MDVSLNFRLNAYGQEEVDGIPICLITIDHDDLDSPIRLSTDPTERLSETASDIVYGTISNGNEYYFFPCTLKLPDDTDDGPGMMQLEFSNVTRDYVAIIRSIEGMPTVRVDMVMSDVLNTVEISWPEFLIANIAYDAATIILTMAMETLEREPIPAGSYTPNAFPGLFRGL
jgi:hypothetical protein